MEKFDESFQNSKKKLLAADHMINVTFNIMHDPKVLMSAINNLDQALIYAMETILYLEEYYKEIDILSDDFNSRLDIFKNQVSSRLKIDNKYSNLIKEVHSYNLKHKNSKVVFSKEESLVICDDDYNTDMINSDLAKKLVSESKNFINLADTFLRGKDVIYRRSKK